MLEGEKIYLRAIEPSDATKVLIWENNPENWRVSGTEAPYSLHQLLDFINDRQTFRQSGQQRLMICKLADKEAIGTIDLYDANFKHGHANIGILIGEVSETRKGYALEALGLVESYAKEILNFHNLSATILEDNYPSIQLFEAVGYEMIGVRKEWFLDKKKRIDERIYQLCLGR